jgi:hypothetical protein
VISIFFNKSKTRKRAQLLVVQFDIRASRDDVFRIESDSISYLIGRYLVTICIHIFLLPSMSEAHLCLDQ